MDRQQQIRNGGGQRKTVTPRCAEEKDEEQRDDDSMQQHIVEMIAERVTKTEKAAVIAQVTSRTSNGSSRG